MNELAVSAIGAISLIAVALIETSRRTNNRHWESNRDDHAFVVDKIESLGKSLGRSVDRIEKTAERTEAKLDTHINDHLTGKLD